MTVEQNLASNPGSHVWVNASAGSGKTKVLVDRLLRLLLEGVNPQKILCLTFTKAAANEMSNRLMKKVQQWALASDTDLLKEISVLTGKPASDSLLKSTKSLFFNLLDHPTGLGIQTLHSFCQSLLDQFPIEAEIPCHFTVLEENDANDLLKECQWNFLKNLKSDDPLQADIETLSQSLSEYRFTHLLSEFGHKRSLLWHLHENQENQKAYDDQLKAFLGIKDQFLEDFETDPSLIDLVAAIYEHGSATDIKKAKILESNPNFENYKSIFLTQKGEIKKTLLTKKVYQACPESETMMREEAERVQDYFEAFKAHQLYGRTRSFIKLATHIYACYQESKLQRGVLDFEDLIFKALKLLSNKNLLPWILQKIEGGLSHILIDEAQDTSPLQWKLADILLNNLFDDQDTDRSLFVVGDIKQSIYSFQGADPNLFHAINVYFKNLLETYSDKNWYDINLKQSFRTTKPVLDVVDALFNDQGDGVIWGESPLSHAAYREGQEGRVEILPLIERSEKQKIQPWPVFAEYPEESSQNDDLANQIAEKTKGMLDQNLYLPSKGRVIEPKDVMILVRKRSDLIACLTRAFQKVGVPLSGADKFDLKDHIFIQDLMALSSFLLNKKDDYSLACVLKGPFVNNGHGFSEDDLLDLCHKRQGTLWQHLNSLEKYQPLSAYLKSLLSRVDYTSLYDLFEQILSYHKPYLRARFGEMVEQLCEQFLSLCLNFQNRKGNSLQAFLHYLKTQDITVSNAQDIDQVNEVRLMTIHGSKGLQAPVVILAESTESISLRHEDFLWTQNDDQDLCLIRPSTDMDTESTKGLKEETLESLSQEFQRLFYVAMTRAEDVLIFTGKEQRSTDDNTWYHRAQKIIENLSGGGTVYEPIPMKSGIREKNQDTDSIKHPLPTFFKEKITDFIALKKKNFENEAIDRGILLHSLLEILPEIPESLWRSVNEMLDTENLLTSNDFDTVKSLIKKYPQFFDPKTSQAELKIGSYRLDRLVVGDTHITILDFKSSLTGKKNSSKYKSQLEIYVGLLRELYPNHIIQGALLWIEDADLDIIIEDHPSPPPTIDDSF